MSYRPHSSDRKKKRFFTRPMVVFLFIAGVLFGVNALTNGTVASMLRIPVSMVWSTTASVTDGFSAVTGVFENAETLRIERDALQEQLREYELYALNNLVLQNEINELRALLGVSREEPYRGVLAQVLSRGGVMPYGTMVISREIDAPLQAGAHVFGAENIAIGALERVDTTSALVRLYSGPGEETAVLIGTQDRITSAVLEGIGNGNMVVDIARDADIRVGDPVVLDTKGSILLGVVGDIDTAPTRAFQTVRVRAPLDLSVIRFVRVL